MQSEIFRILFSGKEERSECRTSCKSPWNAFPVFSERRHLNLHSKVANHEFTPRQEINN